MTYACESENFGQRSSRAPPAKLVVSSSRVHALGKPACREGRAGKMGRSKRGPARSGRPVSCAPGEVF